MSNKAFILVIQMMSKLYIDIDPSVLYYFSLNKSLILLMGGRTPTTKQLKGS